MRTPKNPQHVIPVVKNLSPEWINSLYEVGGKEVHSGDALKSIGMPVGGIAAGQLYLMGDGTLSYWHVFNRELNSGYGDTCYNRPIPSSPVRQGFAVILEGGTSSSPDVRQLCGRDFSDVSFLGEYPIGLVKYADGNFPLKVEMEAFSPFIPLNAKDSALPVTLFHITVENVSSAEANVSVIGWLENAICPDSESGIEGLRRSRISNGPMRTIMLHSAEEAPIIPGQEKASREDIVFEDFEGQDYGRWKVEGEAFGAKPAEGTLTGQQNVSGFLGKGLVNTFIAGDAPQGKLTSPPFKIEREFINFLIGGGNHKGKTCMNLLVDGKTVKTATGVNDEKLKWWSWRVKEFEGRDAVLEIVDANSDGWGHINIDQIEFSDKTKRGPSGPVNKLPDWGTLALAIESPGAGGARSSGIINMVSERLDLRLSSDDETTSGFGERRNCAIAAPSSVIGPKSKRTFIFALGWHFPNHPNGRMYTNWFTDAAEAANYALDNREKLSELTRRWRDCFYDSTLPVWLLDRLNYPVSIMATETCQWWKDGRFWAFEGVGCCHGTCTHVWNYEHAMARLFPELERSARERQDFGAALHPNGLVGFRGDRNYAADGQCGTILKAYREHQMSPDSEFLKRNWQGIKSALLFSIGHDGNDDGLIEDLQHNTYDINYFGANTFVGSLYLAALRAGEEMATEMGDVEFAQRCRNIFESGSRLSSEKLFNGEYFIQDVDLGRFPMHQYADGCLSDQLFGQGWARQLGLGNIYPQPQVEEALRSVWAYNWAPDVGPYNQIFPPQRWFVAPGEGGLMTCTWPLSKHLGNNSTLYRDEVWTGIEYQVAGNMIWEGMLTEALSICRAVHERYAPAKRNPYNEVECGDHYSRAMASWGVFTALSGFTCHGPKGQMNFAPKLNPEDFRSAFTAPEGWGTFTQKRSGKCQKNTLTVRWGQLKLSTLSLELPEGAKARNVKARIGQNEVPVTFNVTGNRVIVNLNEGLRLAEGEALEIDMTH
ncbi:MAG TPA: GH116 family glycosyl hydrolase [Candidatus Brocadiia bacterium]|nr:GH116 family glycosyl hydrolase [Candidatus Brocadiia bacterium]